MRVKSWIAFILIFSVVRMKAACAPSRRAVRTPLKTAPQSRGCIPEKKFSAMKREDVKNKIPSIIDIAQAPEEARLGEPKKSP